MSDEQPDAICQSCTQSWADDNCQQCGVPLCKDCFRTCIEPDCRKLLCPDCATPLEVADGLVDDYCDLHVADGRRWIGFADRPEAAA